MEEHPSGKSGRDTASTVSERVDVRVDQARKYIEKKKGYRPQRNTVLWLTAMVAAMITSAVILPRVLPGKLSNGEVLLGRGSGVSVVPLGPGAVKDLIHAPGGGEGYSAWAISDSREEIAVGWYRRAGGEADAVSVKVKSAYSGRTQTEWAAELKGADPRIDQVGFVPQHNLLWFLAAGELNLIDIKSAQVMPFPFTAPDGSGEVRPPEMATFAGFSPDGGRLAYAEEGRLTVVKGLSTSRVREPLSSQVVLTMGDTTDSSGMVIAGTMDSFAWLGDDLIAVVVRSGPEASASTSVISLSIQREGRAVARLLVPPLEKGSISSISRAPEGGGFAVLYSEGKARAVRRYDDTGRRLGSAALPDGEWNTPLAWTSP